jgi:DNA primase
MLDYINVKYWELCHDKSNLGYQRDNDYVAKCDVCGDSSKKKNEKRLHLYKKESYDSDSINCFNCGYTANMYSYLRDHHTDLLQSYMQETSYSKIENLSSSSNKNNFNNVLIIKEIKNKNILYTFDKPKELHNPNQEVINYLRSRGFTKDILLSKNKNTKFNIFLSKGIMKLEDKEIYLKDYIIIPLYENDKWFGFYSRSIYTKTFHTYIPDKNSGYKLWNYFSVNKKDTVYIFEAIFNALSTTLPGIACLGSDIDIDRLKELSKPVFVFDNDSTGRSKSTKYAKLGYNIFIWPDKIKEKDINDLLKAGWSIQDIDNLIVSNVFSSIIAITKLKLQLR